RRDRPALASGLTHAYVRSPVLLQELLALDAVAVALVEPGRVGLGVEHGLTLPDVTHRGVHQPRAEPGATGRLRGTHPPDPDDTVLVEQPHAAVEQLALAGLPQVHGGREQVEAVHFGIRGLLLDHEHVDAQPQQRVQLARGELVPRGGDDRHRPHPGTSRPAQPPNMSQAPVSERVSAAVAMSSASARTSVYTPGLPGRPQPSPQETMPISRSPTTSGPPESPWHASTPPLS